MSTIAIGDIHGNFQALDTLLVSQFQDDLSGDTGENTVFLSWCLDSTLDDQKNIAHAGFGQEPLIIEANGFIYPCRSRLLPGKHALQVVSRLEP